MPFPAVIDNTMRAAFVKCPEFFRRQFVEGLHSPTPSIDLHAGGCFARGLEVARRAYYERGLEQGDSIEAGRLALVERWGNFVVPEKSNKTRLAVEGALYYYGDKFPFGDDALQPVRLRGNAPGIELCFGFPTGFRHPTTGEPLPYAGRFDMLATDGTQAWVVDEKLTKYHDKFGMSDAWANQWELDAGLTGYVWAAQRLLAEAGSTLEVAGAIVRGIGVGGKGYGKLVVPALRQPWEVIRWERQMLRDVRRMLVSEADHTYDLALGHACAPYDRPCEFKPLCKARNPERLLDNYVVRFWNPLEREEKEKV